MTFKRLHKLILFQIAVILKTLIITSWLTRHPCIDDAATRTPSFSSTEDSLVVIGSDKYAPILEGLQECPRCIADTYSLN